MRYCYLWHQAGRSSSSSSNSIHGIFLNHCLFGMRRAATCLHHLPVSSLCRCSTNDIFNLAAAGYSFTILSNGLFDVAATTTAVQANSLRKRPPHPNAFHPTSSLTSSLSVSAYCCRRSLVRGRLRVQLRSLFNKNGSRTNEQAKNTGREYLASVDCCRNWRLVYME